MFEILDSDWPCHPVATMTTTQFHYIFIHYTYLDKSYAPLQMQAWVCHKLTAQSRVRCFEATLIGVVGRILHRRRRFQIPFVLVYLLGWMDCQVAFEPHLSRSQPPTIKKKEWRPLYSRTRTTTSTRLTWSFFAYSQNIDSPERFILPFFTRKVSTATFSEGGYALSPDRKMIKLLTLITCVRYFDILAKPRSRMTTATTFSRKMTLVQGSIEKISYS